MRPIFAQAAVITELLAVMDHYSAELAAKAAEPVAVAELAAARRPCPRHDPDGPAAGETTTPAAVIPVAAATPPVAANPVPAVSVPPVTAPVQTAPVMATPAPATEAPLSGQESAS